MFGLGPGELLVVILAGLVIFGPERLPKVAQDAGRVLRQMRRMADEVRTDLKEELGPELEDLDLASFSPRGLLQKHLLDPSLDEIEDVQRSVHGAGEPAVVPAPAPAVVLTKTPAGAPYDFDAT